MSHEIGQEKLVQPEAVYSEYVSPRIETVITPADLEREVHYAGVQDGISLGQP